MKAFYTLLIMLIPFVGVGQCLSNLQIEKCSKQERLKQPDYLYIGCLINGTPNGFGKKIYEKEGIIEEGIFQNGAIINGQRKYINIDDYQVYNQCGKFSKNNLVEGLIEIIYKNNYKIIQEGFFLNGGLIDGKRTDYYIDGTIVYSNYEDSKEVSSTNNTTNYYDKNDIIGPDFEKIDLIENNQLYVDFGSQKVKAIFDTGATGLSISKAYYRILKSNSLVDDLNIDFVDGNSSTESTINKYIIVKSFKIGSFTLKNVIATVRINDKNKENFILLGLNLFDKFQNVIYNHKEKYIEIKK